MPRDGALQPHGHVAAWGLGRLRGVLWRGNWAVAGVHCAPALSVGDDIAYWECGVKVTGTGASVLGHRVVEVGQDADGWYAVTKGLAEVWPDPCLYPFAWPY